MIRGKNFRVACFLLPHDRDCQKVYETLTGLIQVPSIKQLPCFQDWPSGLSRIRGEGWNFFDLRTDFDRMGLPSSSWVALDNNYYQICDTYPSILFVPKQTDYATLLGSANFRSRKRLPVLTWVHPNGKCRIKDLNFAWLYVDQVFGPAAPWFYD
ncbi:Myotubularin-related protein 6 [Taenia solium]|eukprot:TsM_001192000 transcript=TsM_001192000 gene=TsM_001192000